MPGFLAGLGVVSAVGGIYSGFRQASETNKALEFQQRMAQSRAILERRRMVRESRARRAEIINEAAQMGTLGSSSAIAAANSIMSQSAFNVSQSFATQATAQKASEASREASMWGFRQGMWQTAGAFSSFLGGGK